MAIFTKLETHTGEEKELYLRVNNIELNNHGVESIFIVRGYTSEVAFRTGKHYMHEEIISFVADVSLPIWGQAYSKLKEIYPDSKDC